LNKKRKDRNKGLKKGGEKDRQADLSWEKGKLSKKEKVLKN